MTQTKETATVKECIYCDKPLPKYSVSEAHIMCRPRRQRDEDDGWYDPARVRKRMAQVEQIKHDRRLESTTEEWDKHQRKEKRTGRIHMRPIGYVPKYTDTVAYTNQNYGLTKTMFEAGEHNCQKGEHHCYLCQTYLPCELFRRDSGRYSGLGSRCRSCDNAHKASRR